MIDTYLSVASNSGFDVVMTDVVRLELRLSNAGDEIISALENGGVQTRSTSNFSAVEAYHNGNPPDGYVHDNPGERSIVELASREIEAGNTVGVFSDDKHVGRDSEAYPAAHQLASRRRVRCA